MKVGWIQKSEKSHNYRFKFIKMKNTIHNYYGRLHLDCKIPLKKPISAICSFDDIESIPKYV